MAAWVLSRCPPPRLHPQKNLGLKKFIAGRPAAPDAGLAAVLRDVERIEGLRCRRAGASGWSSLAMLAAEGKSLRALTVRDARDLGKFP